MNRQAVQLDVVCRSTSTQGETIWSSAREERTSHHIIPLVRDKVKRQVTSSIQPNILIDCSICRFSESLQNCTCAVYCGAKKKSE